ncbi:Chromosome partition protein Smc [Carpediemonas membranifera]|uniref:Chromosome partition protein Smc n=1 Tax=Carpediemonas membranifera TaxID=201153 RepID=A0A8J6B1M7_9EUKA|nr:Chromosome partition protein Smc [Carpediemonas membranifera]|eukprot:KAG9392359.1 Chromosome partition protein Smc [Carpediemonas membranifera]
MDKSNEDPFKPTELLKRLRSSSIASRNTSPTRSNFGGHAGDRSDVQSMYAQSFRQSRSVLYTQGDFRSGRGISRHELARLEGSIETNTSELEIVRRAHEDTRKEMSRIRTEIASMQHKITETQDTVRAQTSRVAVLDADNKKLQQEAIQLRELIPKKIEELVGVAESTVEQLMEVRAAARTPCPDPSPILPTAWESEPAYPPASQGSGQWSTADPQPSMTLGPEGVGRTGAPGSGGGYELSSTQKFVLPPYGNRGGESGTRRAPKSASPQKRLRSPPKRMMPPPSYESTNRVPTSNLTLTLV